MTTTASVMLLPYCPLPADTGARIEMFKHIDIVRELGTCRILSASKKPVGSGWQPQYQEYFLKRGFQIKLREDDILRLHTAQRLGILYAALFKSFGCERAFGHDNPYHKYAFPESWWKDNTIGMNLAVIHYSYWATLPCKCPKVLVLHDLLSHFMWGSSKNELSAINQADLVIVISIEEQQYLERQGIKQTLWSPPAIDLIDAPDSSLVGLVGSRNKLNREGIAWLSRAKCALDVHVYGSIAAYAPASSHFENKGKYKEYDIPYRECGIILVPTVLGTGVQIKVVEALAAGRAVIARRGAMRGLPPDNRAWIEVDTPEEMMMHAACLQRDSSRRQELMDSAMRYYLQHLDAAKVRAELKSSYEDVAACTIQ